ncbi:MAG: hypothetical protein P4L74_00870 [Candidatus Doudnabacteria bacterium]|nr:hypothetical protein [Candidatus Doudnabacteria bacterium]
MKKLTIGLIILIILGVIVYAYTKKEAKAPETQNNLPSQSQVIPTPAGLDGPQASSAPQSQTGVKGSTGADYTPPQAAGGGENPGSNIQVYEIDFDGSKYSPDTITIKAGDYIFFKNKSSGGFWPVAGSAATIAAYPNFNPKSAIASGGEYKFQFTKPGSWSFGDNLHANQAFSVIVSQ